MTRYSFAALLAVWGAALCAGSLWMFSYEVTAGVVSSPPAAWPVESQLKLLPDRATLLMVAHPECPCTRASISELARLMTELNGAAGGYVLFVRPRGFNKSFVKTDLWNSAALIPDLLLIDDEGGTYAALFGAETSGATLLFSQDGELLFHGGLTTTRAHEGASVGKRRIMDLLRSGHSDRRQSEVFGCGLHAPNTAQNSAIAKGHP